MGFSLGMVLLSLIQLYSFIVLVWCLLSWFPNIRWYDQPFKALDMAVRPVCEPLRRVLPAMGGIDFSPMILMVILQVIAGFVRNIP
ncbi:MAG TPA: YggT family protein [Candidatus Obscuribacterales bacterium]